MAPWADVSVPFTLWSCTSATAQLEMLHGGVTSPAFEALLL